MTDFTEIMKKLEEIQNANNSMSERVAALEVKSEDQPKQEVASENPDHSNPKIIVGTSNKEKTLQLTFGDKECSPTALRLFLDHYNLAKEQNIRKNIDGWKDAEFRANELRYQLRGEPALWISQESTMLKLWVKSDTEIIQKLKDRFLGTQCIELNIIGFEELSQLPSESLSQYMTRCQQLGYEAFGEFDVQSTQQRIVWKFLSGIRDPEVRNAVIREKWMKNKNEAKSFEEVLKIAETAKMAKIATVATGGQKSSNNEAAKVLAMSGVKERRNNYRRPLHSSSESYRSGRSSNGSRTSSSSGTDNRTVNFVCHYCDQKSHYGGWKLCPKRLNEDPSWTPERKDQGKNKGKGFQ